MNHDNKYTVQSYGIDKRNERNERDDTLLNSTKGAGAILFSSAVYKGWKFPSFLLTESDERYLFDLEVCRNFFIIIFFRFFFSVFFFRFFFFIFPFFFCLFSFLFLYIYSRIYLLLFTSSFLSSQSHLVNIIISQVKVKLNHSTAVSLLWDILSDFPPHAILSRQGLLQSLLDILGNGASGYALSGSAQEMGEIFFSIFFLAFL